MPCGSSIIPLHQIDVLYPDTFEDRCVALSVGGTTPRIDALDSSGSARSSPSGRFASQIKAPPQRGVVRLSVRALLRQSRRGGDRRAATARSAPLQGGGGAWRYPKRRRAGADAPSPGDRHGQHRRRRPEGPGERRPGRGSGRSVTNWRRRSPGPSCPTAARRSQGSSPAPASTSGRTPSRSQPTTPCLYMRSG